MNRDTDPCNANSYELERSGDARPPSSRLAMLDAMRFIAATSVVIYHIEQTNGRSALFAHAYLAVDYFFVLSGFVIAHGYEQRWRDGMSAASFLTQRLARLWPTMAAGILLGGTVAWLGGASASMVFPALGRQLAFVPVLNDQTALYPLNGVQWSLALEIFANVAHCVLLRRARTEVLAVIAVGAALALIGLAWRNGDLAVGATASTFFPGLMRIVFGYVVGILLFRCGLWRRRRVPGWITLAMLPATLIAASLADDAWVWITDAAIAVAAMPLLVLMGAAATLPSRVSRFGVLGGNCSYPLYALHVPVIAFMSLPTSTLVASTTPVFAFGAALLAAMLWLPLDQQLRRWMRAKIAS